jgi:hypothetical protein
MLRGGQSTSPKPYLIVTNNPNITFDLGQSTITNRFLEMFKKYSEMSEKIMALASWSPQHRDIVRRILPGSC